MIPDSLKADTVLFVYGGRIEQSPSGKFYGNELNDTIVERYLNLGHSVTFLARKREISENQTSDYNSFISKDLKFIILPDYSKFNTYFLNKAICKNIIEQAIHKSDILVVRLPSTAGYWAIDAAKCFSKPYIVEVVGCTWDALWNHSFFGKILAPYSFFRLREYVSKAPFVMYVTKKFLQRRYPSEHQQIEISDVILPEIDENLLDYRNSKLLEVDMGHTIVAGTIGGIDVQYKGHDTVLKAIALLKSKGIKVVYRVAGKGTGKNLKNLAYKLEISDSFEIVGQIAHSKIFDFLDTLDLYIQPSKQEGLPRALVEAMSRACPCFGSKVGGIPELISNKYCFQKANFRELASLIEKLDSTTLIQMAQENFSKAKEFQKQKIEENRNSFYYQFLNSSKTS